MGCGTGSLIKRIFASLIFCAAGACARLPYAFKPPAAGTDELTAGPFNEENPQIERGEPIAFLDNAASWTIGIIPKAILWNSKMDNHSVSAETEEAIKKYITENNLSDVKVRLNEYAPGGEWSRLFQNESVGAGWRYTIGILANIMYTLFPGRFFGGDAYNPYTNSIYLYSDHPAVALHEAGHAKDSANHKWKGSYAALGILPLFSLIPEAEATGDVLGYLETTKQRRREESAYKVLYPAYATYIGGESVRLISIFTPISTLLSLIPVIPAHVVGRVKASNVNAGDDPDFIRCLEELKGPEGEKKCKAAGELPTFRGTESIAIAALEEEFSRSNDQASLQCVKNALDRLKD